MSSPTTAQNAASMTIAFVGQKIISFAYFLFIARALSPDNLGKYTFTLAFTTLFIVLADFGLTNVLVREAARNKEKLQAYLSTALAIKMGLGVFAYAIVVLAVNAMGKPDLVKIMIYLSGVTMVFDTMHFSLYGALRALGVLRYEAFGIIGSQLLTFILGGAFVLLHFSLPFLILAFIIPSAVNVCFAGAVLYTKYHVIPLPRVHSGVAKIVARLAVPFALAVMFARVYSYSDTILLSHIAGDAAVGWYSIASKTAVAFQFIPAALTAALYPRFSDLYLHNRARLARLFEQSVKYLLLAVFPIAAGIGVLSPEIIGTFFGPSYRDAVAPLQFVMGGLVLSFVSFPIAALLNACNHQHIQTGIIAAAMMLNIILNLVLIPALGATGAAISTIVGNALLVCVGYMFVPSLTNVSHAFLLKTALQTGASAALMALSVHWLRLLPLPIVMGAGVVVYVCAATFFGVIDKPMIREAVSLFMFRDKPTKHIDM